MGPFLSRARRISLAAGLCAAATVAASPTRAMTFRLAPVGGAGCGASCPQAIVAEGEIGRETADELIEFLRQRIGTGHLRSVVFLHSPGGSVIGAMKLGTVLRKVGAAVIVAQASPGQGVGGDASFLSGQCMSACVYAMIGGKTRIVPPQSRLGVHRTSSFRFAGKDPAGQEPGYQRIKTPDALLKTLETYVRQMGVSTELLSVAQAAPADSIRVLTRAEVARWRIGKERF